MSKFKVGIIGTGNISQEHIKAYRSNPEVELYALCDIDAQRVEAAGKRYEVSRIFTDANEMLRLEEIDAVSVCTWNSAHAPCAIAALDAGKHVLCEKPMSVSAVDAAKMKAAADKNGKLLMIGMPLRFGKEADILRDLAENGFFGELYYAKARYLRRNGHPGRWFGDKSRSGGGPLLDVGVHMLDYARYLMACPKPVSVYGATYQKLFDRPEIKKTGTSAEKLGGLCDVEDLATAMIRFENGAVLHIEASFSLNIKKDWQGVELFGTKGGANIGSALELYSDINGYMTDVSLAEDTYPSDEELFCNEINHFIACARDGEDCRSTAQDGIDTMSIIEAIYESASAGHEVVIRS